MNKNYHFSAKCSIANLLQEILQILFVFFIFQPTDVSFFSSNGLMVILSSNEQRLLKNTVMQTGAYTESWPGGRGGGLVIYRL